MKKNYNYKEIINSIGRTENYSHLLGSLNKIGINDDLLFFL